jgi:N-acetyl sugar amidotransferase
MNYCKKCIQLDTRPKIYFDKNGICGACLWEGEKKKINWKQREKELKKIAQKAQEEARKRNTYDCVLGVSGGKDSTFAALYARDKLKLNCLLVNAAPAKNTEIGQYNVDNLLNQGFDMITVKVNPNVLKKLIKTDFYRALNISRPTEYPLWASAPQIALAYNVPLIIQGENAALTLGVRKGEKELGGDASVGGSSNTRSKGSAVILYAGLEGIDKKELFLYTAPDAKKLKKAGIKSIWLQYYAKEWSQCGNAQFAIKNGLKIRNDSLKNLGRIHKHSCLDSDFHMVNQLFKYVKLGFGFATDEACYDIREGRLSREEGLALVKKYDGLCGDKYIKNFCNYINISEAEFWKVVNKFRNKDLFKKKNRKWELKDEFKPWLNNN